MTAKSPTLMSEGMNRDNRPKAPAAPPKINNIVTVQVEIKQDPKYPVYAFDMWMWFDSQNAYLDWQDSLEYRK